MKPLEILSDYFASQKLSEIDNQIPTLTRDTSPSILDDENAQDNLVSSLVVDYLKTKT